MRQKIEDNLLIQLQMMMILSIIKNCYFIVSQIEQQMIDGGRERAKGKRAEPKKN